MIEKGEIAIVGAKHHLETGMVEFFTDSWISTEKALEAQLA